MGDFLANQVLWTAFAASILAQFLKVPLYFITTKKFDLERAWETGGLPSSHAAGVSALMIGVGITEGWGSPIFAIAAMLAGVVMYDASGIRMAAGLQATRLNRLLNELSTKGFVTLGENPEPPLEELLGHNQVEVMAGALFGALVAVLSFTYIHLAQ